MQLQSTSQRHQAFIGPSTIDWEVDHAVIEGRTYTRTFWIEQFPEQAARFHSAHGRILRRLGRLEEAEQAFEAAVASAAEGHPSLGTYRGQLEFVRQELAARGG